MMLEQPELSAAGAAGSGKHAQQVFTQTVQLRRPMSRWKAASLHLGICIGIALVLCAVLLFVWYPSPLFKAEGGEGLLFILVGVDVVIGPCITLVIFNPRKKSLRFDLTVVALLQLSALAYGVYTAFQARPAFIVFYNDWFDVVPASGLDADQLRDGKSPEFRTLSVTGPRIVAARMPSDPKEQLDSLFRAAAGFDVTYFPKYYLPFEQAKADTLKKARTIAELRRLNPKDQETIDRFLAAHSRNDANTRYVPVHARNGFVTAMLDGSTGDLLGFVDLVPW